MLTFGTSTEGFYMAVIAVDFDGTLALGDSFPDVNNATPNTVLIRALNHLQSMGHQIVLWTCRENYGGKHYEDGPYLIDAVKFCEQYGLNFDAVNKNIGEQDGEEGTLYGRKISADHYIDDKSVIFEPINWEGYVAKLLQRFNPL